MACQATVTMLNGSFDAGFLLDSRGTVLHMNAVAKRMFGSGKKYANQNITSFILFGDHIDQGKSSAAPTRFPDETQERLQDTPRSATGLKQNGSKFSVTVNLFKLEKCSCCTEDKKSGGNKVFCAYVRENVTSAMLGSELDKELRRTKRTHSALIEANQDATIVINEEGIIESIDATTLQQFGYTEDELLGRNVIVLMTDDDAARHGFCMKRHMLHAAIGKRREVEGRRKNGTTFPIQLSVAEIEVDDGQKRMFVGTLRDISGRRETQEMMMRSERIRQFVVDASFDSMFSISENGTILMANAAAVKQFGWSYEEFIGQNISMICGGGHGKHHDRYLERYLETGEKRVMGLKRELLARRKDDSEFPIELGLAEVKSSSGQARIFCGFVRDLSRQKQDEEDLRQRERLTMGMINSSFDAMLQINERGIIQMVNQAAVDQFGWSREEFINQNVSMIVGADHVKHHDHYIARYLATGEKRVLGKRRELLARRRDGSEFPIELGLTEVNTGHGGERLFCGFVRDLSRQKEDQEKLRRNESLTSPPMRLCNRSLNIV